MTYMTFIIFWVTYFWVLPSVSRDNLALIMAVEKNADQLM